MGCPDPSILNEPGPDLGDNDISSDMDMKRDVFDGFTPNITPRDSWMDENGTIWNSVEKRASKAARICSSSAAITIKTVNFPSSGEAVSSGGYGNTYGPTNPGCSDYGFGVVATPNGNTANFASEHVLVCHQNTSQSESLLTHFCRNGN